LSESIVFRDKGGKACRRHSFSSSGKSKLSLLCATRTASFPQKSQKCL
ncbi:hypothetical protein CP8484711_0880, partial [Chlamydia psittaci 84-8471/1]